MSREGSVRARFLWCFIVCLPGFGTACRRTPPVLAPTSNAPAPLAQQYCWWSSLRTSLPPDSVAARFARTFTTLGFAPAVVGVLRDTTVFDDATRTAEQVTAAVRVHAPRSVLPRDSATTAQPAVHSEGLVLAWVRADTTRVRYYLARDRELGGAETIGRCTTLWRAAMGIAPEPR
jgi:hypothetical protein